MNDTPTRYLLGRSHNQDRDFNYGTWPDICGMARNPVTCPKPATPIIGPFDAPAKTKPAVIRHDNYTLLVVDLDRGAPALADVIEALRTMSLSAWCIYSSYHHHIVNKATGELGGNRWRVLIPITCGIPLDHWSMLQGYLVERLGSDTCVIEPAQISYAPNRSSDRYEYDIAEGDWLNPLDDQHPLVAHALVRQSRIDEARSVELEQAARRPPPKARRPGISTDGGKVSPVLEFNARYSVEQLLVHYGYKRRGNKWLHPHSTSGSPGVIIGRDGRYISKHGCDDLADGYSHDAFDMYRSHNHRGDLKAAVRAAADMLEVKPGVSISKHNRRLWGAQQQRRRAV